MRNQVNKAELGLRTSISKLMYQGKRIYRLDDFNTINSVNGLQIVVDKVRNIVIVGNKK